MEMPFGLMDAGGPKEPCIRWGRGYRSSTERGNFEKEKGLPIVKYRDILR